MTRQHKSKHEQDFAAVEVFKRRFSSLSTEELQRKIAIGYLMKPASAAIKAILRERRAGQPNDPNNAG